MKKILVLNGSPRTENSLTLRVTQAFLKGMAAATSCEVETVHLAQQKLHFCTGCFTCWTKTPGKCVFQDAMPALLDAYKSADLVIWSLPLYYFGMPAQAKRFMDRLLPLALPQIVRYNNGRSGHPSRYDTGNQRFVLITCCGLFSQQNNYEALLKQFDIFYGERCTNIIRTEGELLGIAMMQETTDAYLRKVEALGDEYARTGAIRPEIATEAQQPLLPEQVFIDTANESWDIAPVEGDTAPPPSAAERFMRQMRACYRPESDACTEALLEFHFADLGETHRMQITQRTCRLLDDSVRSPYTTRIECDFALWQSISEKSVDGATAILDGRLKVRGDFQIMLRLDRMFSLKADPSLPPDRRKAPQMGLLLAPWILFWIFAPMHLFWGATAGMAACCAVLLRQKATRSTPYESIGTTLFTGLALSTFWNISGAASLMATSYLLFGILWLCSCLRQVPLTAWYVCAAYGGQEILSNRLFLRTNRILTFLWSMVYLLTAVWTVWLMSTPLAPWTGILNNAAPVLMGLFTAWFAQWYPAKVARGSFTI